jgi:hypothetical protein
VGFVFDVLDHLVLELIQLVDVAGLEGYCSFAYARVVAASGKGKCRYDPRDPQTAHGGSLLTECEK